MNRIKKLVGVAGFGVLCAVGLSSTAHAATTVHPQVNVQTRIGNYPDEQECLDVGEYELQDDGAISTLCQEQPDGTFTLYATFD